MAALKASATSRSASERQYLNFSSASSSVGATKIMMLCTSLSARGSRPIAAALSRYSLTFPAASLGEGWAMKTASACLAPNVVPAPDEPAW